MFARLVGSYQRTCCFEHGSVAHRTVADGCRLAAELAESTPQMTELWTGYFWIEKNSLLASS